MLSLDFQYRIHAVVGDIWPISRIISTWDGGQVSTHCSQGTPGGLMVPGLVTGPGGEAETGRVVDVIGVELREG